MGRNGDFDISAASAVKRAQKALGKHNSSLILVEPYSMKNDPFYEKYYDEVILPIECLELKRINCVIKYYIFLYFL